MTEQTIKPYRNWKIKTLAVSAILGTIALGATSIYAVTPLTPPTVSSTFEPALLLAGDNTTQIVSKDGFRYVKGLNSDGQLGTNTGIYSYSDWEEAPDNMANYSKLSGSGSHTLALTEQNNVYAWGENNNGQTGTGNANPQQTPNQLKVPLPYQTITSGKNHVLAITMTNNLSVWGQNDKGQLGTGDTKTQTSPKVIMPEVKIKYVYATGDMSYAIDLENNVYAWGENDKGQLGLGNTNETFTPTLVPNIKATKIVSNGMTTLALTPEGNLVTWGENSNGLLGNGTDWRLLQQQENERVQREIAAIKAQDNNRRTNLIQECEEQRRVNPAPAPDNPSPTPSPTPGTTTSPTPTPTPSPTQTTPPTPTVTCAEEVDSTFQATDTSSIVPATITPPELNKNTLTPVGVNTNQTYIDIAIGSQNAFAINGAGRLYGWGKDNSGQSGLNINEDTITQVPVPAATTNKYTKVAAGNKVAAAITTNKTLQAWGDGTENGLTLQQSTLPTITDISGNVDDIKMFNDTAFYIDSNGSTFAWGKLPSGLSGTGESFDKATSFVNTNMGLNTVTITNTTGLGLDRSNHLVVWGTNSNSTFSFGAASSETVPVQKVVIDKFTDIAASASVSGLIDENGTVWMLGINTWQQMGVYYNPSAPYVPSPIILPVKAKLIATNLFSVYVVGEDNSVWTWGENNPNPRLVGTHTTDITQLTANVSAMQFLDKNGEVWEWSETSTNILVNQPTPTNVFQSVPFDEKITQLAGGGAGAVALSETGKLYGWGYTSTNVNEVEPFENTYLIDDTREYVQVSLSSTHLLAYTKTGVLFGKGSTIYGALGPDGYQQGTLTAITTEAENTK